MWKSQASCLWIWYSQVNHDSNSGLWVLLIDNEADCWLISKKLWTIRCSYVVGYNQYEFVVMNVLWYPFQKHLQVLFSGCGRCRDLHWINTAERFSSVMRGYFKAVLLFILLSATVKGDAGLISPWQLLNICAKWCLQSIHGCFILKGWHQNTRHFCYELMKKRSFNLHCSCTEDVLM